MRFFRDLFKSVKPSSNLIEAPTISNPSGQAEGGASEPIDKPPSATIHSRDDGALVLEDTGSGNTIAVTGEIITARGGLVEMSDSMRQVLAATDSGQILVSRSHQMTPQVISEIARVEMIRGASKQTIAVDMATLREVYEIAGRRIKRIDTRRSDDSRMQRDLRDIVRDASKLNASDIHIIVNADRARLRFRIDGVMRDVDEMQPAYAFDLLSAAFALADASDATYQPLAYQGARISSVKTELPPGVQSLRLQFNPLANDGRYAVIRILYSGSGKDIDLGVLGYNDRQIAQLATMTARPVGINVISGPTGSGKSTTLKALLERMIRSRHGEINTLTIEDPPEYVITAAQQMPVMNASSQLERAEAFTKAIAAGLRSDPDVMMIGEIRDKASADLAVEGALSGHPIYASLHANTAMDILSRLRDMGIEDFKVFDATVFSGLVGQRLVRQTCPHCRIPYDASVKRGDLDPLFVARVETMRAITPQRALDAEQLHVAGPGCAECSGGYRGRAVLAEIILPDDEFMEMMSLNRKREARNYWFTKLDGLDLLGAAWIRALNGHISPVDIENTVALLSPQQAHQEALERWCDGGSS